MPRAVREIRREAVSDAAPLKVAAYCRVSSDSEDQLHSYAAQIKYYTDYIGRHPDWELADIYADEGLSGLKTDKRDELMRLVADARKGKIDRVLVKSVSRFARNTYDSLSLVRLLKSLGVSVYFEEQDIDTADMDDEFLLTMQSEAAQNESITISENMRWSYRRRMEKGEFFGTVPAYGYKLAGTALEIDEPEAAVVRRIFSMYLSGIGKQTIANTLNTENIPRRYGYRRWHGRTVDCILNNERAFGDALLQKNYTTEFPFRKIPNKGQQPQYYVENSHSAIISREDFAAAQALQAVRRHGGVCAVAKERNPLSGKIICPDCGHRFRRMIINSTAYWECAYHVSGKADCRTIRYSEEAIQEAFILLTHKLTANREAILAPLISQLNSIRQRHSGTHTKIYEIDTQIADLNEHNLTIAANHAKGNIDVTEFAAKTGAVNQRVSALRAQRRKLLAEDNNDAVLEELAELNDVLSVTEPQTDFDTELFGQIVTRITAVSSTEVRFTLKGGLTLDETICRTERRQSA